MGGGVSVGNDIVNTVCYCKKLKHTVNEYWAPIFFLLERCQPKREPYFGPWK